MKTFGVEMTDSEKMHNEASRDSNVEDILNDIKDAITSTDADDEVIVLSKKVGDVVAENEQQSAESNTNNDFVVEAQSNELPEQEQVAHQAVRENTAHVSDELTQQEVQAFENLVNNEVMTQTREMVKQVAANRNENSKARSNSSLEQMIVEAIKPELKAWLNDNLPQLVREIVEKEIKKVIANE